MIKKLLEDRGLSVYAAAKGSGIPYTTLNELVLGKKNIADCSVKTVASLAAFLGVSLDALLFYLKNSAGNEVVGEDSQQCKTGCKAMSTVPTVSQSWQMKRYKKYRFPVVMASEHYDASRIHPLKQKLVFVLSDALRADERIASVTLFGGSTTIRCTKDSDIDVAVKLKPNALNKENKNDISEKIQEICSWNADIVWMDRVEDGSKLGNNIARGAVIVGGENE